MNDVIPPPYTAVLPSYSNEDPSILKNLVSPSLITTKKISGLAWHDYFQIWYLISGEYVHTINNVKYIQKPGSAVIIPPYTIHGNDLSTTDMSTLRLVRIRIHNKVLSPEAFPLLPISYRDVVFKNTLLPKLVNFSGSEKELVDSIMEKVLSESDRKQVASVNRLLSLLTEFLGLYAAKSEKYIPQGKLIKSVLRMQLMNTAVNYITVNSHNPDLSINDVAAHVNMSRRSLTDTFFELIGRTVHSYITLSRLSSAHILLRSTTMSVSEIAEVCGFANSSHLSSCFKREFGCTPLKFRREYSNWQIKYGDALFKNDINLMKWFFEPDEAALIRHWTSMNFIKNHNRNNS